MSLHLSIDNSAERFGAITSIADLASFTFNGEDSQKLHIYRADKLLSTHWRDEIAAVEMEYATGVSATFKDGSKLHVAAWGECCDGTARCSHCGNGAWKL